VAGLPVRSDNSPTTAPTTFLTGIVPDGATLAGAAVPGLSGAAAVTAADAAVVPVGGLLGKYEIRRELGRGGMGAVYLGFDRLIEREVAIKVLTPEFSAAPAAVERFLGEARSIGRLSHPNVVSIYDIDQWQGMYYLVMELLTGGSVAELAERTGRLPWQQACRMTAQAAKGLSAAHAAGLIHRDIKPATDIYSLGATLYRLLTGRYPFESAGSIVALMKSHLMDPVPSIQPWAGEVPAECDRLIQRAMQKRAADRFGSAAEFADALELHSTVSAADSRLPEVSPDVVWTAMELDDARGIDWLRRLSRRGSLADRVAVLHSSGLQPKDLQEFGGAACRVVAPKTAAAEVIVRVLSALGPVRSSVWAASCGVVAGRGVSREAAKPRRETQGGGECLVTGGIRAAHPGTYVPGSPVVRFM